MDASYYRTRQILESIDKQERDAHYYPLSLLCISLSVSSFKLFYSFCFLYSFYVLASLLIGTVVCFELVNISFSRFFVRYTWGYFSPSFWRQQSSLCSLMFFHSFCCISYRLDLFFSFWLFFVIYFYLFLFIVDWRNNFLSQSLGQVAEAQNKQKLMDIQRFLDTSGK